jgi:hypothetical protein
MGVLRVQAGPVDHERDIAVKKQIGIAVAVFSVVAGAGIALAEDGDPPEGTEVEVPLDEVDESTTTSVVEEPTTVVEDEESDESDEATDNHGAAVSQAAHECPTGPGGVHGECVSAVARDHDGDGVPDHGPGSDEGDEGEDSGDSGESGDTGASSTGGHGNGNGNGGGHGRGHG